MGGRKMLGSVVVGCRETVSAGSSPIVVLHRMAGQAEWLPVELENSACEPWEFTLPTPLFP